MRRLALRIKQRWQLFRLKRYYRRSTPEHKMPNDMVTKDEALALYRHGVAVGRQLGYAEGRNDGISIAKQAAQKHFKELIWS